jgi:hypothetical protein
VAAFSNAGVVDQNICVRGLESSETVALTKPSLLDALDAVAAVKVWPAAERDTPDVSVRSLASSIAAAMGCAVHPVMPAKQTLRMTRPYDLLSLREGR